MRSSALVRPNRCAMAVCACGGRHVGNPPWRASCVRRPGCGQSTMAQERPPRTARRRGRKFAMASPWVLVGRCVGWGLNSERGRVWLRCLKWCPERCPDGHPWICIDFSARNDHTEPDAPSAPTCSTAARSVSTPLSNLAAAAAPSARPPVHRESTSRRVAFLTCCHSMERMSPGGRVCVAVDSEPSTRRRPTRRV